MVYQPAGRVDPIENWDGLDDFGRSLAAGTYHWKSVQVDAQALRSKWVMAVGADPVLDEKGQPVYSPGAAFGVSRLASDGESLYLGAEVTDAADVLLKTGAEVRSGILLNDGTYYGTYSGNNVRPSREKEHHL